MPHVDERNGASGHTVSRRGADSFRRHDGERHVLPLAIPTDFASLGAVDGLEELGLRGVVAFGAEDIAWGATAPALPVPRVMEEHEALAERCEQSKRVGFRVGVGTILGQTDALLEASAMLGEVDGQRRPHASGGSARRKNCRANALGKKHGRARQRSGTPGRRNA